MAGNLHRNSKNRLHMRAPLQNCKSRSHNMEVCRMLLSFAKWLGIIYADLVRVCYATGGAGIVHAQHEVRLVCAAHNMNDESPWTV